MKAIAPFTFIIPPIFYFTSFFSVKFDFFIQLFYSLNKKVIKVQTIAFI